MINTMLRLILFTLVCLISTFQSKSQTIYVYGTISTNTNWIADTVKIIGNVTVENGVLLTVFPGTYVEAQGYYKIDVLGRIRAIGSVYDSVVFTVHDTASFWSDTTSATGGWAGINITGTNTSSDTSEFIFCSIRFAKRYDSYGGNIKGGAICVKDYRALVIQHSRLASNMVICYTDGINGAGGGAVSCKNVTYVLIGNNRFDNNRSFDQGGAIYIDKQCDHTIISNNLFLYNKAYFYDFSGPYWSYGGGGAAVNIYDDIGLNPTICNNQCFNNKSPNGVIYVNNISAFVYNNVICNNSGPGVVDGHGLSVSRIFNNTIANNYTRSGGIMIFSRAKVYNNICWRNEQYAGQVNDQINISQAMTNFELFNNCVQYGDGGNYAVYEYPEFVNPTAGVGLSFNGYDADWTLSDQSPCINTGASDTTGLFIPALDIAGNPRIFGNRIEIGAYENQSVWSFLDFNPMVNDKIEVFPNPGNEELTIISTKKYIKFELIDIRGATLITEKEVGERMIFNTRSLNTGIYLYKIYDKDSGVIKIGKWIKY
jgi:predicted outer membrane repeat protein